MGGVDSLTAVPDSSFFDAVNLARGKLGDGGPGYAAFTTESAFVHNATYTITGKMAQFGILNLEGRYSLDGNGIQPLGDTGNESFSWRPGSAWNTARLYYLGQPDGGTMQCGTAASGATLTTISTASADLILAGFDIAFDPRPGGDTITCTNIHGHTTLFGAMFMRGTGGVLAVSMAYGGRKMHDVQVQAAGFRRAWFHALNPREFFLNGGMNDRFDITPDQHYTDLYEVVNDMHLSSPSTRVWIVQSNESSDAATTNLLAYVPVKQKVAADTNSLFIDYRTVLGNYAQALAAGYMNDGVHPNTKGHAVAGKYLAGQAGLDYGVPDPGPTPY